ncbi:Sua5/YciO/YrdC/YwlC family protein [Flagellatimonas centrodinii]|uniref:Sua5/YciO/YrdC/YwlC family protein n=1 Tax=Flagellatimonas centrodinii TaxID=2806210 RepID=UPI001FEEA26A|nr:Sua5/YciO/YrdC/YwlC family protein [Flagellatimonas centrodinii]ULQ45103.1 Sua5/YciO/YrdC/YwlC family protein [Flagellatimonas centrodinii]
MPADAGISPVHLRHAVAALRQGRLLGYPTEAVWGLGCDPRDDAALIALLHLKRRDPAKGLILVAADFDSLQPYLRTPAASVLARAMATWPGPATWVFAAADTVSPLLTGDHDSLAVRVSAHPVVRALCRAFGHPLVSTSANSSGQPPARSRVDLQLRFGPGLAVMPGALGGALQPTPIRDAVSGAILRA